MGFLPAPSWIGVETLNSTSMNVSWDSVSNQSSHAVFYYGDYTASLIKTDSTFEVFNDLQHLMPYLVVVMTVSNNSYGASFAVHTLEAGSYIAIYMGMNLLYVPCVCVCMVQFDWLMVMLGRVKGEWKYTMMDSGELYVMIIGPSIMLG